MIVTTERGRYEIDELGRGKFRLTVLEKFVSEPSRRVRCQSGRYRFHISGGKVVGRSIVVKSLVIRVGASLTFGVRSLTQDPESCCGFTDRIVSIDPAPRAAGGAG